jgi:hypothetical protein
MNKGGGLKMDVYEWVRGPFAWITLVRFVLGSIYRIIFLLLTFLSGFLAHHQWGPYRPVLILHVISSEILLVILPFSKLGHMLFFYFSRAYMGAEYGKILKARDW